MAEKHFYEQQNFAKSYLVPYLRQFIPDFEKANLLEIGCGEAGFLDVLHQSGMSVTGIEIESSRIEIALSKNPNLKILHADITDSQIIEQTGQQYDVIVMRDVIEHIKDRDALFRNLCQLIKPGGFLYITFPPKLSGFAGHQQNGKTVLRYIPYLHLLPVPLIKILAKIFKERPQVISQVTLNYKVGLTIRHFTKLYRTYKFTPIIKDLFLIRPIFQLRFKLTPRRIPAIPLLSEFLAFGCEYLLVKDYSGSNK